MLAVEAVPPPPAAVTAPELSPARRRRHRRRAGGGAERAERAGGKPRSLDEELQQVGWMLREFKTAPCSLESPASHDHRCCPFYHSSRDRRRSIPADGLEASYQGEPCPGQFDDGRLCTKGDECALCHSTAELLYHPDFFRKRLCHQARRCPRGRFCAFAHARHELLAPHFSEEEEVDPSEEFIASRFKTQWCPVGGPHDWESCVYAHTYRDWRRVPLLGYASHPCPRWANSVASGSPGLSYSERCPYGMACPLAHGAKEQLYHPQFYKTSPCSDPDCRRGPLCAFTHGEHDQRQMPLEDTAPRAARRPIPHAEELLRQHQPTFSEPPMYHALEDAPRSGGAPGASKPRRRKGGGGGGGGSSGAAEAVIPASPPAPAGPPAAPSHSGDASRVELAAQRPAMPMPMGPGQDQMHQAMFSPYPACQFMGYQWVISPAGPPQPAHPGAFLGACYAPPPPAPGAAQCLLTVPQPPPQQPQPQPQPQPQQPPPKPQPQLPVQLPAAALPSPSPEDSPVRVSHRRGPEDFADAAERSPMALGGCNPRSPMDLKLPRMPGLGGSGGLSIEVPDFGHHTADFAAWQRNLAEALEAPPKSCSLAAWKRRYGNEGGLRTPSSFGSPALSRAPTRASSPHSAEGASSTHTGEGSEQATWDECNVPRKEPLLPAQQAAWDECNAPREEPLLLER